MIIICSRYSGETRSNIFPKYVLRKTRGAIDVSHTCRKKESSMAYPGHWSCRNSRIDFGQWKYESSAWIFMNVHVQGYVLKLIAAAPRSNPQIELLDRNLWCLGPWILMHPFGERNLLAHTTQSPCLIHLHQSEPNQTAAKPEPLKKKVRHFIRMSVLQRGVPKPMGFNAIICVVGRFGNLKILVIACVLINLCLTWQALVKALRTWKTMQEWQNRNQFR